MDSSEQKAPNFATSVSGNRPERPPADTPEGHLINKLAATVEKKGEEPKLLPLVGVLYRSVGQGQASGSAAMSVSRLPPAPGFSEVKVVA